MNKRKSPTDADSLRRVIGHRRPSSPWAAHPWPTHDSDVPRRQSHGVGTSVASPVAPPRVDRRHISASWRVTGRMVIGKLARHWVLLWVIPAALLSIGVGCESTLVRSADRQVYPLIQQRQLDALGEAHDARISSAARARGAGTPYDFTPHPVATSLPPSFGTRAAEPAPSGAGPATEDTGSTPAEPIRPIGEPGPAPEDPNVASGEPSSGPDEPTPPPSELLSALQDSVAPVDTGDANLAEDPGIRRMGLQDAMRYALHNARQIQDAKEDLYLAALDLTLERHLWTPQIAASLSAEFADFGQVRDFDRAMTTISEISVQQRLPLGGTVTARLLNSLMRDLGEHVTSGETGSFILSADIPLFRNAGRVAYESRYRAERQLIYAVRAYERFRRQFLVNVATDYFRLQRDKAAIRNAKMSYEAFRENYERAKTEFEWKQTDIFEKGRVQANFLAAASTVQDAEERYATALDQFKIVVSMPVLEPLDVLSQEEDTAGGRIENLLPDVDEGEALAVALRYRLDLLTDLDAIDDARRGVTIAKNAILPDLDLTGSITMATDPNEKNSTSYNTERTTWRGMIELRMDDRKTERNAFRSSLISMRRSQRDYERAADLVRADVRRAVRRIQQSEANRRFQALNVLQNEDRYKAADERNRLGRSTNQDLVDAQNDLLRARDTLADAQAGYRTAVLEFRLATGTLRIDDDGVFRVTAPPADVPATAPGG